MSITRRIFVLAFGVLTNGFVSAQNLVLNPGFESFKKCPTHFVSNPKQFDKMLDSWSSPSNSTPDYFNKCSTDKNLSIPTNTYGSQESQSGSAYIGISACDSGWMEYIQGTLSESLLEGEEYLVGFWICLGGRSKRTVGKFGTLFTEERLALRYKGVIFDPPLILHEDMITEVGEWQNVQAKYIARGGENILQ